MPRLFALDHNFPDPIVATLGRFQADAELVRIDAIDARMPDLDDWQLFLALHHDKRHERLRQELTRSAVTGSVVSCRPTKVGGLKWAVRAKIGGPNGQQHFVTVVWFVRIVGAAPVLVTAYPGS